MTTFRTKAIRILSYIMASIFYVPYGISYFATTYLSTIIIFPENLGKLQVFEKKKTLRYIFLLLATAIFPLLIFKLPIILPLGVDQYLNYDNINVFPSLWYTILYIIPISFIHKVSPQSDQIRRGSKYIPRLLFLMILIAIPVIIPKIFRIQLYLDWGAQHTNARCLILSLKSFYYNGLWEELYYRGLLLSLLLQGFKKIPAILISSFVFMMSHVDSIRMAFMMPESHIISNLISILFLGISCGYLFVKTRSLLPAIFFHGLTSSSSYLAVYFARIYL